MKDNKLNIVVGGYLVRGPLGGLAWHYLQYVAGLEALGHRVLFLEDSTDHAACYNPSNGEFSRDATFGLAFTRQAFLDLGLQSGWCYYDAFSHQWYGPAADSVDTFLANADLFLNLSGLVPIRDWIAQIPRRALVDTDPLFTQVKHLQDKNSQELASAHTHFFTFAGNINQGGCEIPGDGFCWRPTRQPVMMDYWQTSHSDENLPLTTVMQWDSYAEREHSGISYGMKSRSFAPYFNLPQYARQRLELALGSDTAPRNELRDYGWGIVNPLDVTLNLHSYRDYIHSSAGEFSVAKHGYVVSKSGWFSERSCNYLAASRPVVVQDCGFTHWLPADRGILAFNSPDQALACLERLHSEYALHAEAANEIARFEFAHDRVLPVLLDQCMTELPLPEAKSLYRKVA